jgi:hypothetical protein
LLPHKVYTGASEIVQRTVKDAAVPPVSPANELLLRLWVVHEHQVRVAAASRDVEGLARPHRHDMHINAGLAGELRQGEQTRILNRGRRGEDNEPLCQTSRGPPSAGATNINAKLPAPESCAPIPCAIDTSASVTRTAKKFDIAKKLIDDIRLNKRLTPETIAFCGAEATP